MNLYDTIIFSSLQHRGHCNLIKFKFKCNGGYYDILNYSLFIRYEMRMMVTTTLIFFSKYDSDHQTSVRWPLNIFGQTDLVRRGTSHPSLRLTPKYVTFCGISSERFFPRVVVKVSFCGNCNLWRGMIQRSAIVANLEIFKNVPPLYFGYCTRSTTT